MSLMFSVDFTWSVKWNNHVCWFIILFILSTLLQDCNIYWTAHLHIRQFMQLILPCPLVFCRSYSSLLSNLLYLPGWLVRTHHVRHAADLGRSQTNLARQTRHTRCSSSWYKLQEHRSHGCCVVLNFLLCLSHSQAWWLDPKQMRPLRLSIQSRTRRAGTCTVRSWTGFCHVSPASHSAIK